MANGQRPVSVFDMPASDLDNGRNDLRRYPEAASDMVPDNVVRDQPKTWG